jgi:hypothetical protein
VVSKSVFVGAFQLTTTTPSKAVPLMPDGALGADHGAIDVDGKEEAPRPYEFLDLAVNV